VSDDDGVEALRLAALLSAIGKQPSEGLPDVAVAALTEGYDTPALRELAGTRHADVRDGRELFERALDELGQRPVTEATARRALVSYWMTEMLEGRLTPREGAGLIWWEGWIPLVDHDLAEFAGLADEWDDLPELRPLLEARILELARRRLAERGVDDEPPA